MTDIALHGCRTQPLMGYLKALGVLRLTAAAGRETRMWWHPARHAVLRSPLGGDGLVDFFLDDYHPSPITSPWNGGSGYFQKDVASAAALTACETAGAERLAELQHAIRLAREILAELGISEAPKGDDKDRFLSEWRARASDDALGWLDATMVLRDDGASMNPLLGTGGNDGRLEFSANFLGRLMDCLPGVSASIDATRSRGLLRDALFGTGAAPMGTTKIGMFAPALSGLPNSISSSRTESALLNPWDLVLMLEGTMAFAGGVGRQLGDQGATFPFAVRDRGSNRVGRSMAGENTRGEVWLPVWREPARYASVSRLLAEGRAQDGRRQAATSATLARAIGTLGVDRGVDEFERVVFVNRAGRSFVAVPVDRVQARASRLVDAQRDAQLWIARLRGARLTGLDVGIRAVDLAAQACIAGRPGGAEQWLLAVGALERHIGAAQRQYPDRVPRPLHGLPAALLDELPPNDPEVRLGIALAQLPMPQRHPAAGAPAIRALLEPVTAGARGRLSWLETATRPRLSVRHAVAVLHVVAQVAQRGTIGMARLADVRRLLDGEVDPARVVELAFAAALCEPASTPPPVADSGGGEIDRLFAASHLVVRAGATHVGGETLPIRPVSAVVPALARGGVSRAGRLVVTRLAADGLHPFMAIAEAPRSGQQAELIAAALAFPLSAIDVRAVQRAALHPAPTAEGSPA